MKDYFGREIDLNFRALIPMGAVLIKDGMDEFINDPDYIAEVKYDGYRMIGWFEEDKIRYTTRSVAVESIRSGSPMPTERTDNVPHLRDMKHDLYGTIIDGEFYKPGCRSHDITSMIGGLPETSIANQEREGYVHYVIYDILQYKGEDLTGKPLHQRRLYLKEVLDQLYIINENAEFPKGYLIEDYVYLSERVPHENKRTTYEKVVAEGGEGLILKHVDSNYHLGKIDKNGKGVPSKIKASSRNGLKHTPWVKWKKYDTFDCVIMGFEPATIEYKGNELETWKYWEDSDEIKLQFINKYEAYKYATEHGIEIRPITKFHFYGWPGAIQFGQYKDGKLIKVGDTSGISDENRKKFAENPDAYIGKVVEVGAMERIKKTNALREPRFLRFRDDKNDFECVIE
jgi:ATP dependent DNA ligase domain